MRSRAKASSRVSLHQWGAVRSLRGKRFSFRHPDNDMPVGFQAEASSVWLVTSPRIPLGGIPCSCYNWECPLVWNYCSWRIIYKTKSKSTRILNEGGFWLGRWKGEKGQKPRVNARLGHREMERERQKEQESRKYTELCPERREADWEGGVGDMRVTGLGTEGAAGERWFTACGSRSVTGVQMHPPALLPTWRMVSGISYYVTFLLAIPKLITTHSPLGNLTAY